MLDARQLYSDVIAYYNQIRSMSVQGNNHLPHRISVVSNEANLILGRAEVIASKLALEKPDMPFTNVTFSPESFENTIVKLREAFNAFDEYYLGQLPRYVTPLPKGIWQRFKYVAAAIAVVLLIYGAFSLYDYVQQGLLEDRYEAGADAYNDQDWPKAIDRFEAVRRMDSDYENTNELLSDGYINRADELVDDGKFSDARNLLRRDISLDFDQTRAKEALQQTYFVEVTLRSTDPATDRLLLDELADEFEGALDAEAYRLYENTYYQEAELASSLEDWATVEAHLLQAVDYMQEFNQPQSQNVIILLAESYLKQAEQLIVSDTDGADYTGARDYLNKAQDLSETYRLDNGQLDRLGQLYVKAYLDEVAIILADSSNASRYTDARRLLQPALSLANEPFVSLLDFQQIQSTYSDTYYDPIYANYQMANYSSVRAYTEEWLIDVPDALSYRDTEAMYYRAHYVPAIEAYESETWPTAYDLMRKLYALDSEYPNLRVRYRETILQMGIQSFQNDDPEAAEAYFEELFVIDFRFAISQSILLDFYYNRVVASIDAEEWEEARGHISILNQISPGYRNIDTLLRDTYYIPIEMQMVAVANAGYAVDLEICLAARADLETFFARDDFARDHRQAQVLYHDTYYCEAQIAIQDNALPEALDALRTLNSESPLYKNASTLYIDALYQLGSEALEAEEWESARLLFRELLDQEEFYLDSFTLLREAYYRPARIAFEAQDYATARSHLRGLIYGEPASSPVDPNYLDVQMMLRDSFYLAATAAFNNEDWAATANALYPLLVGTNASSNEPLLPNGQWTNQLPAIDPNYQNSHLLFFQALSSLTADSITVEDYDEAENTLLYMIQQLAIIGEIDSFTIDNTYEQLHGMYYQQGTEALARQNWGIARSSFRTLLTSLADREGTDIASVDYQDAQMLYREAYYQEAVAAIDTQDWPTARMRLIELLTLVAELEDTILGTAVYKDSQMLLREAYYQPGTLQLTNEEWEVARATFLDLLELVARLDNVPLQEANYKDTADLYLDTFYLPAEHLISAENWQVAQESCASLISAIEVMRGADADYRDARQLQRDVYLLPAEQALNTGDWGLARENAHTILRIEPELELAIQLLINAHRLPAQQALEQKDWEVTREHLLPIVAPYLLPPSATPTIYYNIVGSDRDLRALFDLYTQSYIQPIQNFINSGNANAARNALVIYERNLLSLNEQDDRWAIYVPPITGLLASTYGTTFQSLVEQGDWYGAAQQFISIQRDNAGDVTIYLVLQDHPELRAALANLHEPTWRTMTLRVSSDFGQTNQNGPIFDAILLPDSYTFVYGGTSGVLWLGDADISLREYLIQTNRPWIEHIVSAPHGNWIATAGGTSYVDIWSPQTGERLQLLSASDRVLDIQISPNGDLLAVASEDGNVYLWDTTTWAQAAAPLIHSTRVSAIQFSHDAGLLFSATGDGMIHIWDMETMFRRASFDSGEAYISTIVAHPQGGSFFTSGNSTNISHWNSVDGTLVGSFEGHASWIEDLALTANGNLLFSIGDDQQLVMWDVAQHTILQNITLDMTLFGVFLSPDSTVLYVVGALDNRGVIVTWTVSTNE